MTSSDVTLTVAQSAFFFISISGTLTTNVSLILPANFGGSRQFLNGTSGAFTITVKNGASDTGGGVVLPRLGFVTPIVFLGNRAQYDSYQACPPGTILDYASPNLPPGFLWPAGQGVSTTAYSQLFSAIGYGYGGSGGTFVLPDLRGRVLSGPDNLGGSAAGRMPGWVASTSGGEYTHTLTTGEMPSHNHGDSGHGHGASDSGHDHPYTGQGSGFSGVGGVGNTAPVGARTGTGFANISIGTGFANITFTGGNGAHNNVQPSIAINKIIRF